MLLARILVSASVKEQNNRQALHSTQITSYGACLCAHALHGSHSHVTKFLRYSFQRTLESWPCLTLWGRKPTALAYWQPVFSRSPTVSRFSLKWKCSFVSFCSACLYVGVVGYCGVRNLVKVESRNTDPRASSQFDHVALIRARNHPPKLSSKDIALTYIMLSFYMFNFQCVDLYIQVLFVLSPLRWS